MDHPMVPRKRVKIPGLDAQGFNLMLGEFVIISHLRSHMSDADDSEVSTNENEEEISILDKAMIIGLEEIIDILKEVNENLELNNSNITYFRQELNLLRVENEDRYDELMLPIYDEKGFKDNTILKHLGMIRLMLFWALFGIPIIATIVIFIAAN